MSTESLIELGKRLVEEFKLEDKTDTLSQWLLHYLAELFERYNLPVILPFLGSLKSRGLGCY